MADGVGKAWLINWHKPDTTYGTNHREYGLERTMMNETEQLLKRFQELAEKAYARDICLFTNFLNLNELDIFYKNENSFRYIDTEAFGGAIYCERKILRFGNLNLPYPVSCIHIRPVIKKFSDTLTHRDFLGALINLGIKRETLGDILVREDEAYVFCLDSMADFITDNLDRVKHTVITCRKTEQIPETNLYNIKEKKLNTASLRLDALIGEVYDHSRSQSQQIIRERKVFVNGRLIENNSYTVKPEDTVTVRGMGKFIFDSVINTTKKGRYNILVKMFV